MKLIYDFFKKYKILKNVIPDYLLTELQMKFYDPYGILENKNKFIFVHIPKTAGIGIIQSLYDKKPTGHFPLIHYKKYCKEKFDNFFKFAIVRNPWDRLVSAFFYLKQGGMIKNDKDFAEKYLKRYDTFEEFVLALKKNSSFKNDILSWVHFVPQYKFIYYNKELYCFTTHQSF